LALGVDNPEMLRITTQASEDASPSKPGQGPAAAPARRPRRAVICLDPEKVGLALGAVVLGIALCHFAGQYSKYFLDHDNLWGFVHLFDLNHEENVPTWYSSSMLLLASLLLLVITALKASSRDRYTLHWAGLAAGFAYMSLDETVGLHGQLAAISPVSATGIFYYAWVIPAAIAVAVIALVYLRFLFHLPVRTRRMFLLAGFTFTGGALGVEMIAARQHYLHGMQNMTYAALTGVEDSLEMAGVALFIYALLRYLSGQFGTVEVRLGGHGPRS
jgi:hypothetical protein